MQTAKLCEQMKKIKSLKNEEINMEIARLNADCIKLPASIVFERLSEEQRIKDLAEHCNWADDLEMAFSLIEDVMTFTIIKNGLYRESVEPFVVTIFQEDVGNRCASAQTLPRAICLAYLASNGGG